MRKDFLIHHQKQTPYREKDFVKLKKTPTTILPTNYQRDKDKVPLILQTLGTSSPPLIPERQGSGSPASLAGAQGSGHPTSPHACAVALYMGGGVGGGELPALVAQPRNALCLFKQSSGQHKRALSHPL